MSEMTQEVMKQILLVRDTGETNMFDMQAVQYIAINNDWFDLVAYLGDLSNYRLSRPIKKEYFNFIVTGKNSDGVSVA